jgi:hypothetical protein
VPHNIVNNINTENVAGFNNVKFIKIKAPGAMNYFGVNQLGSEHNLLFPKN